MSIGGAFSRLALRSVVEAARELRAGRFAFVTDMLPIRELHHA